MATLSLDITSILNEKSAITNLLFTVNYAGIMVTIDFIDPSKIKKDTWLKFQKALMDERKSKIVFNSVKGAVELACNKSSIVFTVSRSMGSGSGEIQVALDRSQFRDKMNDHISAIVSSAILYPK